MNQSIFNVEIPVLDKKRTKKKVDEAIERYRMLLLQKTLDEQPKITATYSIVPAPSSLPVSSTEKAAIKNADYEVKREKYINWFIEGVNRLPTVDRKLICLRYLQLDELYDYQTYAEMNISEGTYYRAKAKAFERLGYALGLEVYKEE